MRPRPFLTVPRSIDRAASVMVIGRLRAALSQPLDAVTPDLQQQHRVPAGLARRERDLVVGHGRGAASAGADWPGRLESPHYIAEAAGGVR